MPASVRTTITTHDLTGRPRILAAEDVAIKPWRGADAGDATVWSTRAVPANNSDADLTDEKHDVGNTLHSGSVFRVTELGPGFTTPMHRTLSTDYIMALSGQLEMILDGGETIRLLPGDTVVQRGTRHAWRNPNPDTRCRFVVSMIEAQPIVIDGRRLGATPTWRMVASVLRARLMPAKAQAPQNPSAPTTQPDPRAIRRVVTGHDQTGRAIVLYDDTIPLARGPGAETAQATLWQTPHVPADNTANPAESGADTGGICQGSAFQVVELQPRVATPPRRSSSIDYIMVLEGELGLALGQEETITLHPGETAVQRGTRHTWRNPSQNVPCRFLVSVIEARPLPNADRRAAPAAHEDQPPAPPEAQLRP